VIDLIKAELHKRRMTQQELAELAGVSEPCIFRFLRGNPDNLPDWKLGAWALYQVEETRRQLAVKA
jgi:hypothetical protein